MKQRILLVEDETAIAKSLQFLLSQQEYDVKISTNGNQALADYETFQPDLILLDLMLPGLSGIEVCRQIRAKSNVPIIMLTAKNTEIDKVVGLELGADDYITKPYLSRELIARIHSVLRRVNYSPSQNLSDTDDILEISGIRLDMGRHTVAVNGKEIEIPLKEFDLLAYLMSNAGYVLTRAQLLNHVWGVDFYGDTKTLDVHIKRLRGRIEPDPTHPTLISTVRGVGYRFN